MKQYLLKLSGLAALALMLHGVAFAQDNEERDTAPGKDHDHETIIIRSKGDKDIKLNVEIKDGKVLINGKPTGEFKDENVTVHVGGDGMTLDLLGNMDADNLYGNLMGPRSPFRNRSGGWSYSSPDSNRAFLGVSSVKEEDIEGAKVTNINEGSGAEKAGLKKGDLITRINDIAINDPEDLSRTVRKFKPKESVTVTFKREGKEQKVSATLGHLSIARTYSYSFSVPRAEEFKMMMPPDGGGGNMPHVYSFDRRPRLGIKAQDTEDGKGVKVLSIEDGSVADKAGIKEGDIILGIDGKTVNSAAELADQAREINGKNEFKVSYLRNGTPGSVMIKIPKRLKTAEL